jgi:hypothetical protein
MKKLVVFFLVLLSIQLFSQVPNPPFNPMTANGARHIYSHNNQWGHHILYWENPSNVLYNDVYISTDSNLVINLDPAVKVLSGFDSLKSFDSLSLELLGILDLHTKYYWRVVEYNSNGFTAGPVWYFISQSDIYSYWDDDFSNGLTNYELIEPYDFIWSISPTNYAGGFSQPELKLQIFSSNFNNTAYLILNDIFDLCTSINPIQFRYSADWISGEFEIGLAYSLDEGNSWQSFWQQIVNQDISSTEIYNVLVPNENYIMLALYCKNNQSGSAANIYFDDLMLVTPLTVPTPPSQIKASSDSLSTTVSLSWTGGFSPDPISGYILQRKEGSPTSSSPYYTITQTNNITFSYLDTDVQLNHIYTYRISTKTPIYYTAWSNEATAYVPAVVPVELLTFSSSVIDNDVTLNWITATETNNSGFQIERSEKLEARSEAWINIDFVNGNGTTTETKSYSFNDENLSAGRYQYRLKQIDFDGSFEYSNIVEAEILPPAKFSLEQNYPNPFNPTTIIKYSIPDVGTGLALSNVTLKVFDVLGNEVSTLVDEEKPAGSYQVEFNASELASGLYFYQLKCEGLTQTKKMILIK